MRVLHVVLCVLCFAAATMPARAEDKAPTTHKPMGVELKSVDSGVVFKNSVPVTLSGAVAASVKAEDPAGLKVRLDQPVGVRVLGAEYLNGVNVLTHIREVQLYFAGQPTPVTYSIESRASQGVPCIAGDWILVDKQGEAGNVSEVQDWRPLSQIVKVVVRRYPPAAGKPSLQSLRCGE